MRAFFIIIVIIWTIENDRRILEKKFAKFSLSLFLSLLSFCQILDEKNATRCSKFAQVRKKEKKFRGGWSGNCIFRRFKRVLIFEKYGETFDFHVKPCYFGLHPILWYFLSSNKASSTLTWKFRKIWNFGWRYESVARRVIISFRFREWSTIRTIDR